MIWIWVGAGVMAMGVAWLWWEIRRAPLCDQDGNPIKEDQS